MKTNSLPKKTPWASVIMSVFSLVGTVAIVTGCVSEPNSRIVSAPPPTAQTGAGTQTVVVPTNQHAQVAASSGSASAPVVVIQQPPPAAQQENAPLRPTSNHVWVAGYWVWRNDRYEWTPGQWVIPPQYGAVWVPPRWEREGNAFRFYDGYWDT